MFIKKAHETSAITSSFSSFPTHENLLQAYFSVCSGALHYWFLGFESINTFCALKVIDRLGAATTSGILELQNMNWDFILKLQII